MMHDSRATAGVWGMDPVLGIAGDYSTNPTLLDIPHTAEASGAILVDAPISYAGDADKLTVLPDFRLSNQSGYSSVTSDYEHFQVKNEFHTERTVLTTLVAVDQDSSLYHDFLSNGSTGVRRDTLLADVNWERHLTELVDFNLDFNPSRVRFGEGAGVATLVDYKNVSISPTVAWAFSERTKFTFAAAAGRYNSIDGTTESRNGNVQFGFTTQLTEIWSLTATLGFSRALNQLQSEQEVLVNTPTGPAIEIVPLSFESSQNGTVYLVNAIRQGSRLTLNATASRQLTPSGFAFLSRQDTLDLTASYLLSERWTVGGDAKRVDYQSPGTNAAATQVDVTYLTLNANWRWTEHWTVIMAASRVSSDYESTRYSVASNEVTLTLSRQFNHIGFN